MTKKELERKLNIRTAEDMEKEFQRLDKKHKKSMRKSIKANLELLLEHKKNISLKDKLIASNYYIAYRQARKTHKNNKDKELYPAWDYIATEEFIAERLLHTANKAKDKKEIKKIFDRMKIETEILRSKTNLMKHDNWIYEREDDLRERLADYTDTESIEANIEYRKLEDEGRIKIAESEEKVKEAKKALDEAIDECCKRR